MQREIASADDIKYAGWDMDVTSESFLPQRKWAFRDEDRRCFSVLVCSVSFGKALADVIDSNASEWLRCSVISN